MSWSERKTYDRLDRFVRLEGRVEVRTALHVGKGRALDAGAASDLPVMRDVLGRPFIPGSSLKGVMRSYAEALVRGLSGVLRTCDPVGQVWTDCVDPADFAEQQKKGVGQGAKKLEVPRDICDVCNLFGHPIFASRLRFADMKVKAGTWHELLLQVRDGVAIDRETGTVAGPMKFDFEVVPPGVQFELAVTADNVEDWQLAMLFAAVEAMNDGVGRLGGSTSRGLGAVELKFDKYLDMTAPELLTGKKEPKTDLDELRRRCAGQLSEVLGNGGQQ